MKISEKKRKPTAGTKTKSDGKMEEFTILRLNEDGEGVAAAGDREILFPGAFPGETVGVFGPVEKKTVPRFRILRRSPDRVPTPCRGTGCDGCPLMALKYPAQLAWKKGLVRDEMAKYSPLKSVAIADVLPSPRLLGYRTTAKLAIGGKHADLVIGVYKRNSHDIVDIGDCPLHHPLVNRIVAAVREGIRKGKVPIYNPRTRNGLLRYVVVRVSETENRGMVIFVTAQRSYNEIHHLAKFVKLAVPEVDVAGQNVNPSEGNVILGTKDHFETRQRTIFETIHGIRFELSPRSFFQVNPGGAGIVYGTVMEWSGLTGKEKVLDLYCGIGTMSLLLARNAAEVTGVEVVEQAVEDAAKNAARNGIRNCRFEAGDASRVLRDLAEEGNRFDLVVLNPPRKGCDREVIETCAALAPAAMIYVSCSPASLARDLYFLSKSGYVTEKIQPVDMFPQTPHVESVALLRRKQ
jgi:23S rRNA (uracil1939-C5)-methyltransferase